MPEAIQAIITTARTPREYEGGWVEPTEIAESRGDTDIALVLLLSSAGLRISEAAGLTWENVERWPDGTERVTIGRSKLNQKGIPQTVAVSEAAMDALEKVRPDVFDPAQKVFNMYVGTLRNRIKRAARYAGLGDGFSGHSGRVGMVRTMTANGSPTTTTMKQGRWTTPESVSRYNRREEAGAAVPWLSQEIDTLSGE